MITTIEPQAGIDSPWWVGKQAECYHCGSTIRLDAETDVEEASSYEGKFVYFDCPVCGSKSISLSDGECPR